MHDSHLQLPEPKQIGEKEFEAALDRMAQLSDKIPFLPLEAFSRENLYNDCDEWVDLPRVYREQVKPMK